MATLNLALDLVATVPLIFKDHSGVVRPAPATGSVTSSDASLATAVLASDGGSVLVTPLVVGSVDVTYTNGSVTATMSVLVIEPEIASVEFDVEHATFTSKP